MTVSVLAPLSKWFSITTDILSDTKTTRLSMRDIFDPRVQRVLNVIETRELSATELRNLFTNVTADDKIDEADRDLLVSKLESKLRVSSTKIANALFGPKDSTARITLEEAHHKVESQFDLTGNRVRNGVKTGGDMIAGRAHIDVYISYKNHDGWHVSLGLYQIEVDSPLLCRLRRYNTRKDNKSDPELLERDATEFDNCLNEYMQLLAGICMPAD